MQTTFLYSFITGQTDKPNYKSVKVLRQATSEEEKRNVYVFYEYLIQSVVGHKCWRKSRSKLRISEAITTSQEATALWILKNYENRWNNSSDMLAKFTGSTRGNRQFQGWSIEGINEYNDITKHVMNDRTRGHAFEEEFMEDQVRKLDRVNRKRSIGDHSDTNKRVHPSVICYDDLNVVAESDVEEVFDPYETHSSLTSDMPSISTDSESVPYEMFPVIGNQMANYNQHAV